MNWWFSAFVCLFLVVFLFFLFSVLLWGFLGGWVILYIFYFFYSFFFFFFFGRGGVCGAGLICSTIYIYIFVCK